MSIASRIAVASSLFALFSSLAGCTQSVSPSADAQEDAAREEVGEATSAFSIGDWRNHIPFVLPAVYNAFLGGQPCVSIDVAGGQWVASYTFGKNSDFCTYVWSGATFANVAALSDTLIAQGVDGNDISQDLTCLDASCARPSLVEIAHRLGGGGASACYKCFRASVAGNMIFVALPPALVTTAPSMIQMGIEGGSLQFNQPGGVAAFSVTVTNLGTPMHGVGYITNLVGNAAAAR